MKKFFAVLFALILSLCLFAGCKEAPKGDEGETDTPSDSDGDGTDDGKGDEEEIVYTPWEEDGVMKILMIGNSFSYDTAEYLYQIGTSLGVEDLKIGFLHIGGTRISDHATNARYKSAVYEYRVVDKKSERKWDSVFQHRMVDALQSDNWDFVTFQQGSTASAQPETFGDLDYLTSYVRRYAKTAKFGWIFTWSYETTLADASMLQWFTETYQADSYLMWEGLRDVIQNVIIPTNKFAAIMPQGTAVQNARTSFIGKLPGNKMTRDGYHLNLQYGRYTAGLTFFSSLTGIPIDEETVFAPSAVDEKYKAVCIESAKNAIANPYEVTQSVYTEE